MEDWFQALEQANLQWKTDMAEERGVPLEQIEKLTTIQAYADDQVVLIAWLLARELERKWECV